MDPNQASPGRDRRIPAPISGPQAIQPSSPRLFFSAAAAAAASPGGGGHRRIAIAVDLSDESAYAIRWAVRNYLRPGDAVVLLHVRPTSVLYGADWGAIDPSAAEDGGGSEESKRRLEDEFDAFTASKAQEVAQPLAEARIPFKIHIVRDHDMKERLCIEVERLGIGAVIMGSRGFGATRSSSSKAGLGSVSDYCVHHCACPVVVVRFPDDGSAAGSAAQDPNKQDGPDRRTMGGAAEKAELHPLPQQQQQQH